MTTKTSVKITNKSLITQVETLQKVLTEDKFDNRPFCNYIYKKENALYATDTKEVARIIVPGYAILGFTDLPEGFYEVIKKNQKTLFLVDPEEPGINDGNNSYPDMEMLFEKELPGDAYIYFKAENKERQFSSKICELIEVSGVHFNFERLLKLEKVNNAFVVDYGKETDPIRFMSGHFTYMLMPISKPDYLRNKERNAA